MSASGFTLRPLFRPWLVLLLFGFIAGLLGALGAVFISLIYDYVLPTQSLTALGMVCLLFFALYAAHGFIKAIMGRLAEAMGLALLDDYEPCLLKLVKTRVEQGMMPMEARAPLNDLAEVASAIRGPVLAALLDLLIVPVLLLALLVISPYLFGFAALMLGVQILLAWHVASLHTSEGNFAGKASRGRSPLADLGTEEERREARRVESQRRQPWRDAKGTALTLREVSQSGILALGAWLVMAQSLTVGMLLAIGFLMVRIYVPVQAAGREIRAMRAALAAFHRLQALPGIERSGRFEKALPADMVRATRHGYLALALVMGAAMLFAAYTPAPVTQKIVLAVETVETGPQTRILRLNSLNNAPWQWVEPLVNRPLTLRLPSVSRRLHPVWEGVITKQDERALLAEFASPAIGRAIDDMPHSGMRVEATLTIRSRSLLAAAGEAVKARFNLASAAK